jgi:hypothetical protein
LKRSGVAISDRIRRQSIGGTRSLPSSIELQGQRIFCEATDQKREPVMTGKSFFARICYPTLLAACAWLPLAAVDADAANNVFLQRKIISSTIPANGDVNP